MLVLPSPPQKSLTFPPFPNPRKLQQSSDYFHSNKPPSLMGQARSRTLSIAPSLRDCMRQSSHICTSQRKTPTKWSQSRAHGSLQPQPLPSTILEKAARCPCSPEMLPTTARTISVTLLTSKHVASSCQSSVHVRNVIIMLQSHVSEEWLLNKIRTSIRLKQDNSAPSHLVPALPSAKCP